MSAKSIWARRKRALLKIENLEAYYGSAYILQGVSLEVGQGQGVALLGRNGAGKSTMFKSIMGLGPRTHGAMYFKGKDLMRMKPYRRARLGIAYIPEDRRIFSDLSVVDNLIIGQNAAVGRTEPYSIDEIMEFFPLLKDLRTRQGSQMSGGQQQILTIARSLMSRPELILLDEPMEGLAPLVVQHLAHMITGFCTRSGVALLVADQNLWFCRQCTTDVYLMDQGKTIFSGSWAAFDARGELKTKYLAV